MNHSRVPFFLPLLVVLSACGSTTGAPPPSDSFVLPEQERLPSSNSAASSASSSGGGGSSSSGGGVEVAQYALPTWTLQDVQPQSRRFNTMHGLETYRGKALVVVLLEGFCSFCQSNSLVAEELQVALNAEGLDAQVVILGDANASQFASRVALPIFRDGDGSAWRLMRETPSKHDTFVYGPDGKRTFFWPGSYQGDAARWRVDVGAAVRSVAAPK